MSSYYNDHADYYKIVYVTDKIVEDDGSSWDFHYPIKVKKSDEEIEKIKKLHKEKDEYVKKLRTGYVERMQSIDKTKSYHVAIFLLNVGELREWESFVRYMFERGEEPIKEERAWYGPRRFLYKTNYVYREYTFHCLYDLNIMRGFDPNHLFISYQPKWLKNQLSKEQIGKISESFFDYIIPICSLDN
jgi:hypothetical protein